MKKCNWCHRDNLKPSDFPYTGKGKKRRANCKRCHSAYNATELRERNLVLFPEQYTECLADDCHGIFKIKSIKGCPECNRLKKHIAR